MANVSKIPDSIMAHKPAKCCQIRNDKGTYRVYKYGAKKLPNGKWTRDSGYLIGKIIESVGFVPNKRYQKELDSLGQHKFVDETTDVAYGQYALLLFLSQEVYERLKTYFPYERATQIYCYGLILCANGFLYMDQIDEFYQESYLSLIFQDFSFGMGYTAISNLLHDLGMKGNPVRYFEQSLIDDSSKSIAIDGHVVRSCSQENDLAEPGYKMNMLKAPQVNILIAFDTKSRSPLMYKTFRGSSVDKKSIEEFLQSRSFKDTKFIVDRGFFSDPVLELMSQNGNTYIIPVLSTNKDFTRIKKTLQYSSGEFVYRASKKETARVIYYEEALDENRRMIIYKDVDENNSKRKSYKQHMDAEDNNYTQENYDKYSEWWGVYVLQTTTKDPAHVVYSDYKSRWSIETYNNYIKNDAGFNFLKIQDYYIQRGFDFIMLVTGLIHSRLNESVKLLEKSNISTFDIIVKSGHMRMVKEGNQWNLHNTRTKDIELLEKMGFKPALTYIP